MRHVFLAILLTLATPILARAQQKTKDGAMRLVVMIESRNMGMAQKGAGLIIGSTGDTLYILTANHVLRDAKGKAFRKPTARLRLSETSQEVEVPLTLLDYDAKLDIAAAKLQLPEGQTPEQLPMDWLEAQPRLVEKTAVAFIGYGGGYAWSYSTLGNALARTPTPDRIWFETNNLTQGYSGGGLFTSEWYLIGLVQRYSPPEGQALPIDKALAWASGKGYPIALRPEVTIYSFTAEPTTVARAGSSTRLTWKTSLGSGCKIDPEPGAVEKAGSREVTVNKTTRFTLVCEAGGHTTTQEVIVKNQATQILQYSAEPVVEAWTRFPEIGKPEGNVLVKWDSENANGCTLNGEPVGARGQRTLRLGAKPTLNLVCHNETTQDSRTLVATSPVDLPASIQGFQALPAEINAGESAELQWLIKNATKCRVLGGGMNREVREPLVVKPALTTKYILNCRSPGGSDAKETTVTVRGSKPLEAAPFDFSASIQAFLATDAKETPEPVQDSETLEAAPAGPPASIQQFQALPAEIKAGESAKLQWISENATSCRLLGGGMNREAREPLVVKPALTTTYSLRCYGPGGSAKKETTVTVR